MFYFSTRGTAPAVSGAQAVLTGMAPDGGLYLPDALPAFDWQAAVTADTQTVAKTILSTFLPDIPHMAALVDKAYTGKFETEALRPNAHILNNKGSYEKGICYHRCPAASIHWLEPGADQHKEGKDQ